MKAKMRPSIVGPLTTPSGHSAIEVYPSGTLAWDTFYCAVRVGSDLWNDTVLGI